MKIWANTLVRNEERYIWFAAMSVIEHVDKILIWDTGSDDATVMIIKEIKKLYHRIEKDSKVIFSAFESEEYKAGCSCFCFGQMPKTHRFMASTTEHVNDLCHCYYTPLKGAILFLTNEDDLWGELNAKIAVLNRILKVKCKDCGEDKYKHVVHTCPKCGD